MRFNQTAYTKAVEHTTEAFANALEIWVKEEVDTMADFGNPEKLMGMPYENWKNNPTVLNMLAQIYGPEPNPLSNLIFRKTKAEVEAKESALKRG